jgi:hypothetical protein
MKTHLMEIDNMLSKEEQELEQQILDDLRDAAFEKRAKIELDAWLDSAESEEQNE